jgi:uncharacterized protein YbjT (DUF2867 family)
VQIAVTTPTGNVGREVVHLLVRAGLRPRVLVRDPARLDPHVRGHVDAVAVDLADGDAVVAATEGVGALFWVSPSAFGDDPVGAHARLGSHAARAVTTHGIARVVFQSSVGAERRHGAGEIDGLARIERSLDATGTAVTHLRCGFFFTNLLLDLEAVRGGVVRVVLPLDRPMPWVAPRDVAEAAVLRLLAPGRSGRTVQAVHGPADLTWTDVARIVSAATGRRLRVDRVGDDDMRAALRGGGLPDGAVDAILGMSTGLRDGFVAEQPRDVTTTTPTTLAAWAYDTLRPLLQPR